jgi:hypothetical protein
MLKSIFGFTFHLCVAVVLGDHFFLFVFVCFWAFWRCHEALPDFGEVKVK